MAKGYGDGVWVGVWVGVWGEGYGERSLARMGMNVQYG